MSLPSLGRNARPGPDAIWIVPLGGLGEVGMNCFVVESEHDAFVVDCGVTFPEKTFGASLVHPRFDHILARRDRIRAIVVTHGHEDHVGAVPFLLRSLDVPVYAPPYALGVLQKRLEEVTLPRPPALHPFSSGRSFGIGEDFEVEPFAVHHSIPDAHGLVLRTPAGVVVHTADFKIEREPAEGQRFDEDVLLRARDEGVRLLLSDSTNIDVEGRSGLERLAHEALLDAAQRTRGRIIVGSFSSNSFRLASALEVARRTRRKVALLGRSMGTHARLQESLGHLPGLSKLLVPNDRLLRIPPDELLVVATGTQGEAPAALARLAKGTHPDLRLAPGDAVVLSSRIIPGCEVEVHRLVDAFERAGILVHHRRTDGRLHASGHACREEQREMIQRVEPEGFMPVHGTFHHLTAHAALAREVGVPETLVVENGAVVEVTDDALRVIATVTTGIVHRDGDLEIPDVVLRERATLARAGVVFCAVPASRDLRRFGAPRVRVRGLVDAETDADRQLVRDAEKEAARALHEAESFEHEADLVHVVSRRLRRFFQDAVRVKPVVDVLVTPLSDARG